MSTVFCQRNNFSANFSNFKNGLEQPRGPRPCWACRAGPANPTVAHAAAHSLQLGKRKTGARKTVWRLWEDGFEILPWLRSGCHTGPPGCGRSPSWFRLRLVCAAAWLRVAGGVGGLQWRRRRRGEGDQQSSPEVEEEEAAGDRAGRQQRRPVAPSPPPPPPSFLPPISGFPLLHHHQSHQHHALLYGSVAAWPGQ